MSQPDAIESLRADLLRARDDFHRLAASLTDDGLRRPSRNPGWTNGEVLFHIAFAFIILRALAPMVHLWGRLPRRASLVFARALDLSTPVLNVINGAGARIGARAYSRARLLRTFDNRCDTLMRSLDRADERTLTSGMHYPARWDALFREYMTLADVYRYPISHFRFHEDQITHRDARCTAPIVLAPRTLAPRTPTDTPRHQSLVCCDFCN